MRRRIIFAALVLLATGALKLTSQVAARDSVRSDAPPVTHVVRTTAGSTFVGRLLEERADSLRFETPGGTLVIARSAILELRAVSPREMREGEYWFPNPHTTRLFFAPTGRMLRQGEGYYSNTYLFLNGLHVGVADRFTIGGNTTLFPSNGEQIGFLTPKVGVFASQNVNVAAGALLGYNGFADDGDERHYGLLYSVATFGSADASTTAGIGWGYLGSKLARRPAAMLGATARLSKRSAFVTENYLVPTSDDHEGLFSYGFRFFGEKLSVDLAFVNVASEMVFPGFPFVSFVVKF